MSSQLSSLDTLTRDLNIRLLRRGESNSPIRNRTEQEAPKVTEPATFEENAIEDDVDDLIQSFNPSGFNGNMSFKNDAAKSILEQSLLPNQ
jgi:hypothetical protein